MNGSAVNGWHRLVDHLGRCSQRRLLLYLSFFFLATRLAFLAVGVRFDADPLGGYWQYLDPQLLRDDLLRSLFYLHSQPPLFNLFLGLVLKLSPISPTATFQGLFAAAGLICYLSTFALMLRLGTARAVAFCLSTVVVCRPSFILFENWLMYDVPVTALLGLAAVTFAAFASGRSHPAVVHAFFIILGVLCATRSLFHLLFFFLAAALSLAMLPDRRRQVARAATIPAVLLMLLYAKNLVVFGHPGPSSWMGMNLSRIVTSALSADDLDELQQTGQLSLVDSVPPFSPVERYPARYFASPRYPGVPAVADRFKSTGSVNYNHEAYLEISRDYFSDATRILSRRPDIYLHGMAKAWYNYFKPQTELDHVSRNRQRLRIYIAWCEPLLHGRLPGVLEYGGQAKPIYLFPTLGVPLLLLYALASIVGSKDRKGSLKAPPRRILAFLTLTILYTALVGNSLEVWENQRFRFYADPFVAVILASALTAFFKERRQRAGHATPRSR